MFTKHAQSLGKHQTSLWGDSSSLCAVFLDWQHSLGPQWERFQGPVVSPIVTHKQLGAP